MATSTFSSNCKLLIVGCGAIGGVLATILHSAGQRLSVATTNEEVRKVWARSGPYLNGKWAGPALPTGRIFASAGEAPGDFDVIFVAVPPPQIDSVAQEIQGKLSPRGRVVCLSNGMCETRLVKRIAAEQVVGAVVLWGARMPEPARYRRTSRGGFVLGYLGGGTDQELEQISSILEAVGKVRVTDNLLGARFGKLAINCAISALGTIGGDTLGALLVQNHARSLAVAIMREAIDVAHAEGIHLERVAGVDLGKLVADGSNRWSDEAARHALLLAVGSRYRKLRSSMLAAMERGRTPAVDFVNGEISRRGRAHGLPTPYNDAACSVIWDIFHKHLTSGAEALAQLDARAQQASTTLWQSDNAPTATQSKPA